MSANGRLQGRLEVSRAFGDRQFKKVFFVKYICLYFLLSVVLAEKNLYIAFYG